MGFVQIVEFNTSKIDEVRKSADDFRAATEGKRTVARVTIAADRDNPGRHFVIAEFPSYEEAMKNSELPETQELAKRQQALSDGPPTFYNLDVIEVHEG
jgi:quinol monooxygenase YgiN